MPVFRVEKNNNYTVMSNYHLKDKKLSLKAKGLLSVMLSLPDTWDYTQAGLVTLSKDGVDSVRNALGELERYGYLVRERVITEKGQFADVVYFVYEKPLAVAKRLNRRSKATFAGPESEKPTLEKQISGNPISGIPILDEEENPDFAQKNADFGVLRGEKSLSEGVNSTEPQSEKPILDKQISENQIFENQRCDYPMSGKPLEVSPVLVNPTQLNTDNNKRLKELNTNHSIPFRREEKEGKRSDNRAQASDPQERVLLSLYGVENEESAHQIAERTLKRRLEYDYLVKTSPGDKEILDALLSLMITEVFVNRRKKMRIASGVHSLGIVRKRFLRLDFRHLQKIIENLKNLEKDPKNDKQYILACLFNAPDTMPIQVATEISAVVNGSEGRENMYGEERRS